MLFDGISHQVPDIDPLETADAKEMQDPAWYEKKMRENLEALLDALPDK